LWYYYKKTQQTHHQYKRVDHANDSNESQTANELDTILWELEVDWLWEQYWPHQLSFGRWKA